METKKIVKWVLRYEQAHPRGSGFYRYWEPRVDSFDFWQDAQRAYIVGLFYIENVYVIDYNTNYESRENSNTRW